MYVLQQENSWTQTLSNKACKWETENRSRMFMQEFMLQALCKHFLLTKTGNNEKYMYIVPFFHTFLHLSSHTVSKCRQLQVVISC